MKDANDDKLSGHFVGPFCDAGNQTQNYLQPCLRNPNYRKVNNVTSWSLIDIP